MRFIGSTCLPRYRLSQTQVARKEPASLCEPVMDAFTLPKLTSKENANICALMETVRVCARRGGPRILQLLRELLEHRLLGAGPGKPAHQLVDKFMNCVRNHKADSAPETNPRIYANNPRDPGNKQRARINIHSYIYVNVCIFCVTV